MASFTPINIDPNANGAYFSMQLAGGEVELDVFAVYGLPAGGDILNHRELRSHFRQQVIPHVFERGGTTTARTQGPDIPTWQIVNITKGIFAKLDQDGLEALQTAWRFKSVQTWNPFAQPGTPEAFVPAPRNARLPDQYYKTTVEEVADEYDINRPRQPNVPGSQGNPFDLESDDEMQDVGGDPMESGAGDSDAEMQDADDAEPMGSGAASGGASSSRPRPAAGSAGTPPAAATASRAPVYQAMPGTPQKRRVDPRGLLLGTWRLSGLHADRANAVYGSRDRKNRINRRISKQSPAGAVVLGGNFNNKKTACKHADVDYLPQYQGMTDEEVKSHIMPLLIPGGGAYVDVPVETETPRSRKPPVFAVRGARFYGSADGEQYDQSKASKDDPFV